MAEIKREREPADFTKLPFDPYIRIGYDEASRIRNHILYRQRTPHTMPGAQRLRILDRCASERLALGSHARSVHLHMIICSFAYQFGTLEWCIGLFFFLFFFFNTMPWEGKAGRIYIARRTNGHMRNNEGEESKRRNPTRARIYSFLLTSSTSST